MTRPDGDMPPPLLAGMRIVEVSAFIAAPFCGLNLAQLGAEVIRIDPIRGGPDLRRAPLAPDGTSLYWTGLNKHKRSVAIDLGCDEGRELATALATAPGPDRGLLVTNLPAVGWLDYARLKARRADLVMAVLSGHNDGTTAVDYTVNAGVGLPQLTGPADSAGVVNHLLPAWDLQAGMHLAVALLAADRHRARTGEGQRVDLALSDVAYATMSALGFVAEAELGGERERAGNHIFGAYGRDFATADGGRVMVAGISLRQWRSLVEATGSGEALAALESRRQLDFRREEDCFAARHAIDVVLAPWFAARSAASVGAALDAARACWAPYRSVGEMVRDDPRCSTASPIFDRVAMPGIGDLLSARSPLRPETAGAVPAQPASRLGADTAQVLARDLGLGEAQLDGLRDRGIIPAD